MVYVGMAGLRPSCVIASKSAKAFFQSRCVANPLICAFSIRLFAERPRPLVTNAVAVASNANGIFIACSF